MSIAAWNEGDLRHFIRKVVSEPGAVRPHEIVGLDDRLTGEGRIARGSTTLTGTGGSTASVSVAHGLTDENGDALTPEQILICTDNGLILAAATARSSTNFTLSNATIDGSTYSSGVENDWVVIG